MKRMERETAISRREAKRGAHSQVFGRKKKKSKRVVPLSTVQYQFCRRASEHIECEIQSDLSFHDIM